MRTFKFRAWEKPMSEEWNKKRGISYNPDFKGQMVTMPLNNYFGLSRFFGFLDDEQYILMQYTGFEDRNGKEIYEGDIAVVKEVHDGDEYVWNNEKQEGIPFKITWEHLGFKFGNSCMSHRPHHYEVIGNIYENPELLK